MMKDIFGKSVRRIHGSANLDGVRFNYEFRLRWLPFDVCHRKEDKDSFPFILFEENGNEKVAIGGHDDSYDDIIVANAIDAKVVVLKGRGWSDAHCMVVDKKHVSVNTLLAILLSMSDDHGIDVSTWKVYNPLIKCVVPEDIYRKTTKRVVKRIRRILALYEKVLFDEAVFSDYFEKHSDSVGIKKMKKKIQDSVKEYELSYRCGLLNESEKEHADMKEKL